MLAGRRDQVRPGETRDYGLEHAAAIGRHACSLGLWDRHGDRIVHRAGSRVEDNLTNVGRVFEGVCRTVKHL